MSYYIAQNDETKGPYTIGQLRSMWNAGTITGETLFCQEGYDQWLPLRQLQTELEPPPVASAPPPVYVQPPMQPVGRGVQTIEATGKGWKAAQLISTLIAIFGVLVAMVSPPFGVLMLIGGIFVFCIARIGAWWSHG
jgi:hypothetical protein